MPGPIDVQVQVAAPAATVWALITDIENSPQVVAGIDKVERLDDASGFAVGTKWRETRTMFGKTATEDMTVTVVDPGRSYTTEAHNRGVRYLSSMTVEPTGADSCVLSMHFSAEVSGLLNKTLGAVVGRLMMGTTRKMMQQDLNDIAAAAAAGRA